MQYDYEKFTPDRFQEFCGALLARECPDIQVYPVGQADGGRDARSRVSETVYQVKFSRKRLSGKEAAGALIDAVSGELAKIERLSQRGTKNYVILTNLGGTATLDSGSMDRVQEFLDRNVAIPARVLWRDDLDARLNNAYDLRWTFSEIVTSGDMLRQLIELGLGSSAKRRMSAITGYLTAQYASDEVVKFKQADLQASDLISLFIDVPVASRVRRNDKSAALERALSVVGYELAKDQPRRSETARLHRESVGAASFLLSPVGNTVVSRLVIEGAPGQGKSTLSQYICQVQRMRILGKNEVLDRIPHNHKLVPARIPFRVDLRDLSTWIKGQNPFKGNALESDHIPSLEAFIAAQVHFLSGGQQFSVSDFVDIAARMPILVFLDGLDEVASTEDRRAIINTVDIAADRLQQSAASVQIAVTSRPAAVANSPRFTQDRWDYVDLVSITEDLIYDYAERWARARKLDERDVDDVRSVLKLKLHSGHVADLARNAMQLTILLTLIHVRGQALPDHRTELYDRYVDIFFTRESEKSDVVRRYRQLLVDLHGYLAWKMHCMAEAANSNGRISETEMIGLISEYLDTRGFGAEIVEAIFAGVVQRVVALVSRVEGTFEFEVQPLREYFAARHLYDTAPYSPVGRPKSGTKPEIFAEISSNPYWLNVTRFYAGCYSSGELAGLAEQVVELVNSPNGKSSFVRGLATSLLADHVFHQAPKSTKMVAQSCLDALTLRFGVARAIMSSNSVQLALPDDCGNDESCQLLVREISKAPFSAASSDVSLIAPSFPVEDRMSAWRRSRPRNDSGEQAVLRWLRVGEVLSLLPYVDPKADNIDVSINKNWRILVEGGCPAVLTSRNDVERAVAAFLDGELNLDNAAHGLAALPRALDVRRAIGGGRVRPWLSRMDTESLAPIGHSALDQLVQAARESSRTWSPKAENADWIGDIISRLESVAGQTWLGSVLAMSSAIHSSAQEPLPGFAPQSVQWAKLAIERRSDCSWWCSQLAGASSSLDARRVAAMFIMCATPRCLTESYSAFGKLIECISLHDFADIVHYFEFVSHSRASVIPNRVYDELLGRAEHERAVYLITQRASAQRRHSYVKDMTSDRLALLGTAAADALVDAWLPDNMPERGRQWDSWISQAKLLYTSSQAPLGGLFITSERRSTMPVAQARAVVDDPTSFPIGLLTAADRSLAAAHQAKIQPVALKASEDHWAAN